MNWKRIWTGALLGGLAIWLLDVLAQGCFPMVMGHPSLLSVPLAFVMLEGALVDGFFCSWLYAVIRPRFGPGPRTALLAGSAIYFIKQGLAILALFRGNLAILWTLYTWLKLLLATYLAGWQYIEKAP